MNITRAMMPSFTSSGSISLACYTLSQKRTYQNATAKNRRISAMKIRSSSIFIPPYFLRIHIDYLLHLSADVRKPEHDGEENEISPMKIRSPMNISPSGSSLSWRV